MDDDVVLITASESSKEELVQLIKRFGAYLTFKMSNLFSMVLFLFPLLNFLNIFEYFSRI